MFTHSVPRFITLLNFDFVNKEEGGMSLTSVPFGKRVFGSGNHFNVTRGDGCEIHLMVVNTVGIFKR